MPPGGKKKDASIALGDYDSEYSEEDYLNDDEIDDLERQRDGINQKKNVPSDKDKRKTDKKEDATEESAPPKPKRVLAPRAKLNADRLVGERGLPALLKDFEKIQWQPKGSEKENLHLMMRKLEEWAHRMYPKTRFDDTLEKIEHLGNKRPVKTCVLKLLSDMPILPDDFVSKPSKNVQVPVVDIPDEDDIDWNLAPLNTNAAALEPEDPFLEEEEPITYTVKTYSYDHDPERKGKPARATSSVENIPAPASALEAPLESPNDLDDWQAGDFDIRPTTQPAEKDFPPAIPITKEAAPSSTEDDVDMIDLDNIGEFLEAN